MISFNYDCYLDYLLVRAYKTRRAELPGDHSGEVTDHDLNSLTSGFVQPANTEWAGQRDSFKYLKLHGSIDFPRPLGSDSRQPPFQHLFESDLASRKKILDSGEYRSLIPPVIFPWEFFRENGTSIDEQRFSALWPQALDEKGPADYHHPHKLYTETWNAAREAVTHAAKISFVGLSMHHYLDAGWKFLFQDRTEGAAVFIANRDNEGDPNQGWPDTHRPRFRVAEVLQKAAPCIRFHLRKHAEIEKTNSNLVLKNSFMEFISQEIA